MKKKRWSYAETGLRYIASSPPQEHGGFHPEAVSIAKAALRLIAKLGREIELKEIRIKHLQNITEARKR